MLNWFRKKQAFDPNLPTPRHKHDKPILEDIAKLGWSVVCIDDGPTPYQFSVGLFHSLKHPEIAVMGLPPQVGGTIINQIGAMIKLGATDPIEPDRLYEEYTNNGNYFKVVDTAHYETYFGTANWLYQGAEFPMLQCVWPLKSGHYPWDEGYPSEGAAIQPLLAER